MHVTIVEGDLFEQAAEALVNPWNINVMPVWWPSGGVSAQLRKRTGPEPWRELRRAGRIPTGATVMTRPGDLQSVRAILHVAGLHPWWRASERSIRAGMRSAAQVAVREGLRHVATPIVGAGTGGIPLDQAREWIVEELRGRPDDDVDWLVVVPRPDRTMHAHSGRERPEELGD